MIVEEKEEMTDKQFSTYLHKDIPIDKINEVFEKVLKTDGIYSEVKLTE
jgi:hypothetical protein